MKAFMKAKKAKWEIGILQREINCYFVVVLVSPRCSSFIGKYDVAIGTMVKSFTHTRDVARVNTLYKVKTTNPQYMAILLSNGANDGLLFLAAMGFANNSLLSGKI